MSHAKGRVSDSSTANHIAVMAFTLLTWHFLRSLPSSINPQKIFKVIAAGSFFLCRRSRPAFYDLTDAGIAYECHWTRKRQHRDMP